MPSLLLRPLKLSLMSRYAVWNVPLGSLGQMFYVPSQDHAQPLATAEGGMLRGSLGAL